MNAKSTIEDIRSAIEYYCTSKLKAGIGQIQIMDLDGLEESSKIASMNLRKRLYMISNI